MYLSKQRNREATNHWWVLGFSVQVPLTNLSNWFWDTQNAYQMQSESRISYQYVICKQCLKEKNTQGKYLPVWAYLMTWYFVSWPLLKAELSALTVQHCSWVLMSRSGPNILYICLGMYFPTWITLHLSEVIHFIKKKKHSTEFLPKSPWQCRMIQVT